MYKTSRVSGKKLVLTLTLLISIFATATIVPVFAGDCIDCIPTCPDLCPTAQPRPVLLRCTSGDSQRTAPCTRALSQERRDCPAAREGARFAVVLPTALRTAGWPGTLCRLG